MVSSVILWEMMLCIGHMSTFAWFSIKEKLGSVARVV